MKFTKEIESTIINSILALCFFGCVFKCNQDYEKRRIEDIKSNTEISIKKIQAKQDSMNLEKIKIQTKQLK